MMTGLSYDVGNAGKRCTEVGIPTVSLEPRNPADGVDGARLRSKDVDGSG